MKREATPLEGVCLLQPRVFGDDRGFFMESWNAHTFRDLGLDLHFVQDNHSRSRRGILRGLHYQTEHTRARSLMSLWTCGAARPPWASGTA